METVYTMEQRTSEWHAARLGKATASRVADIVAKTKSGYAASRANYLAELVLERITGEPTPTFVNAAMQHGIDFEAEARGAYSFVTGNVVEEVGFVDHPSVVLAGASPDGLIGDDGLLEIKCPQRATHLDTLLTKAIPGKYRTQMLWQMACTGRQWCDFVSYHPEFPDHLRLFVQRLDRDDEAINDLQREVATFVGEVNARIEALNAEYAPANDDWAPNPLRAG